eukprot:4321047-Amphidinium_carterae.1
MPIHKPLRIHADVRRACVVRPGTNYCTVASNCHLQYCFASPKTLLLGSHASQSTRKLPLTFTSSATMTNHFNGGLSYF